MPPRPVLPSAVYPITDAGPLGRSTHVIETRALLAAGAGWLQLRDKARPAGALLGEYRLCCRLARARGARALVNDRADLALAAGAAGVHLGEEDLPAEAARRVLGGQAMIGVSTHTPEAAERAAGLPVDYVALGPIFPTPTKPDAHPCLGLGRLRQARLRVAAPLVAIGGISLDTLPGVLRAGADAAALISALWAAPDGAGAHLRSLLEVARATLRERLLPGRHVYLVGFMGAGKSTLGPLLAEAMARPFIDLDREVERQAECTIADLFARRGERVFRRLEAGVLRAAAGGREAVIALGGGALGLPASRARVRRTGVSVWVDVPLTRLRERCRGQGGRPLYRDGEDFVRLYRARRPLYAASDLRLAAGALEPPALARRLLGRLRGLRP